MIDKLINRQGINVTINTTEDCNLKCSYCYEQNKKPRELPIEYAKKFIDLILLDEDPIGSIDSPRNPSKLGIIIDFIGGDSLMNPKFIDEILEYYIVKVNTLPIAYESYRLNWAGSISSNGTLFSNVDVRNLCEKWKNKLQVGVSIDGCPELHDLNRAFKDGRGSMSEILKNWDWYAKLTKDTIGQLSTKSTLARDSIIYISKSLKYMYEVLGITQINQNFIMEDTKCNSDDYLNLVKELNLSLEYVISHRHDLYWSIFDREVCANHTLSKGEAWNDLGKCGSGSMPCLGINGNIYPCFRWAPHTQSPNNPEPIIVGDIWKGFYNKDGFRKVRDGCIRCNCTKEEKCRTCPYESACSYCIGGCFAEFQEFRRTTYICEITKIQCEYAKRYYNEYNKLENVLDDEGHIKYYPIDHHYDLDKYYYDPDHVYNPE